jgi:ribosome-associated translation inhibitor RaiA
MQVIFESRDPGGAELRDMAVRRLRFVMRRLTWLVPRAKVRLSDINGPRGGIDKRCQVELKTDLMGTVVITSMASDWRTALDSALARASRVLTRSWRRSHAQPRRAHPHAGAERLLAEQNDSKPNPK